MKYKSNIKLFKLIIMLTISIICLSGCNKTSNEIVEIKEDTFLTQMNDILLNKDEYIDKVINLEGIFFKDVVDDEILTAIYRNTPGCCGNDGIAGFDLLISSEELPENNDWVKVSGTLKRYYKDDNKDIPYLRLEVSSIEVKEDRGKDFVIN